MWPPSAPYFGGAVRGLVSHVGDIMRYHVRSSAKLCSLKTGGRGRLSHRLHGDPWVHKVVQVCKMTTTWHCHLLLTIYQGGGFSAACTCRHTSGFWCTSSTRIWLMSSRLLTSRLVLLPSQLYSSNDATCVLICGQNTHDQFLKFGVLSDSRMCDNSVEISLYTKFYSGVLQEQPKEESESCLVLTYWRFTRGTDEHYFLEENQDLGCTVNLHYGITVEPHLWPLQNYDQSSSHTTF